MHHLSHQLRPLFDLPPLRNGRPVIELRSFTHGLPPKAVKRNLDLFYEEWKTRGVDAWNQLNVSNEIFLIGDENQTEKERAVGWWNLPEVLGDRFIARLLHAPQGTCIMLPNATQIVLALLSCAELNKRNRRKIICTDGEFPAVLHSLHHYNSLIESVSANPDDRLRIEIVKMGENAFNAEHVLKAIDDETCLVIFSHVGFVRGERIADADIRRIADKCHQHGALIAIDGYHAVASHIIDVQKLDVDCYFGGLLKEGCGSSGSCFLYIRSGLDLHPRFSGWIGDRQPFAFAETPQPHDSVRRRFLTGTPAIASLYHSTEGLKILLQAGLPRVADDMQAKVLKMLDIFQQNNVRVVSPLEEDRISALVVLAVEAADACRDALAEEHGVLVDARRNRYIRLAPHVYNTSEEIESAAQMIVDCLHSGAYRWRPSIQKTGPVT